MNIIKLQNQLKGVPDDALVGYVQNPTGQVPTYLALSELQRRKEMRSKYQANQPEEKSVAEDLVQEAQPGIMSLPEGQPMQPQPEMPMEQMAQGGLAELDTGNMYDENNYANGGIVAFAEGGTSRLGDYFSDIRAKNLAEQEINKQLNQLISERARLKYDFLTPLTAEQKAAQDKTIPQIDTMIADLKAKKAGMSGTQTKGGWEPPKDSPPALTGADVSIKNEIEEAKKNPFTGKALYSGLTTPVEKIGSLASYANELKNYIGEDPTRQKLTERLAKMEDRATKMEEQAPWLALAKAGFEMASARPEYGKGQSALADIARGAGVGVKDYAESRDKLNTLEEKRFNIENELAKASRAEQIAVAKYGADSKQAAEARAHADRLHNSSIKTQFKIAELNASTTSGNRLIAAKDKIEDNVRAKIKDLITMGTGPTTENEYNRLFKKLLAEAYAQYGVSGAPVITESMPGNMVFDPKTKEYTYKPKS